MTLRQINIMSDLARGVRSWTYGDDDYRALRALEASGLAVRRGNEYVLTPAGRRAEEMERL